MWRKLTRIGTHKRPKKSKTWRSIAVICGRKEKLIIFARDLFLPRRISWENIQIYVDSDCNESTSIERSQKKRENHENVCCNERVVKEIHDTCCYRFTFFFLCGSTFFHFFSTQQPTSHWKDWRQNQNIPISNFLKIHFHFPSKKFLISSILETHSMSCSRSANKCQMREEEKRRKWEISRFKVSFRNANLIRYL